MNITESNCNYHLNRLQKENEQIGHRIDLMNAIGRFDSSEKLMKEYERNYDLISELIAFRNDHNCLLEGDPGYGPM